MITITDEGRLYGADSFIEQTKYPKATFGHLQRYLGEPYSDELIEQLKKDRFVLNEIESDDRGLIGWKVHKKAKEEDDTTEDILYTEELLAMILKLGKQFSEKQAGGTVKDCVITIPSYYTPSQRRMM